MRSKLTSQKGSALLIVVIIMTIIIMMGSIMLSYSIQNIRHFKGSGDVVNGQNCARSGLNEILEIMCREIDLGNPLNDFANSNSDLFADADGSSYDADIYISGFDPNVFKITESEKSYRIKKAIAPPTDYVNVGTLYPNIAIKVKGVYKEAYVEKRYLVDIVDGDESYIIVVHNCY